MAERYEYLKLTDLRGGINNTDEPQSLSDDQVVDARNIDWDQGTLGGKRGGCAAVSLTGSVFERFIPSLVLPVTTGGIVATTTLNIAVPAFTSDGSAPNVRLLVKINHKSGATNINTATFGGVAMTLEVAVTNGAAGRISIYSFTNPSAAGGTVSIVFAANVDATAVCEVWQRCDQLIGAVSNSGTSGIGSSVGNNVTTNPTFMVTDAFGKDAGGAVTIGFGQTLISSTTSGTAILMASSEIGVPPTVVMDWTTSTSVAWAAAAIELRGMVQTTGGIPIIALMRHRPTTNVREDELWAVDFAGRMDRRVAGVWQLGVPQVSQYQKHIDITGLDTNGASLHGKFFIASLFTGLNTLAVWDGTVLRWAGFPFVPAPLIASAADDGAGTLTGTRYYRVRYVQQVNGVVVRRSEPNATVTFTPSGAGSGVLFTKPSGTESYTSLYSNGQTHWELEASIDNVLFYRLATTDIGTQFFVDTTPFATGYSAFPLSDLIGENTPPVSSRFVAADDDRLVMGGNRLDTGLDSRVTWTPTEGATGVGNDERIPLNQNFVDLDNLSGGGLQAMVVGESGNIYAFKWDRTYKLSRTGIAEQAYAPQTESHSRGATKLGAVSAHDEDGSPAVYFTDPSVGLCRASKRGIEHLGQFIQTTWDTITLSHPSSSLGPRLEYWPQKHQIWIAVSVSGNVSTRFLVFNTTTRVGRGFAIYESALMSDGIYTGVMFPDATTGKLFLHWAFINPLIIRFTTTDVNDAGTRYRAYWTSKAYVLKGLFAKFGVMAGVLFANARASTTIGIDLIRNLGQQRLATPVSVSIAPAATETHVFKPVDNATLSELFTIQFELGDPAAFTGAQLDQTWILDEYVAKVRSEDEGTS